MKQLNLSIQTQGRGYYLVSNQIEEALSQALTSSESGLLHVFLKHTSASLTINENADPTVRDDFKNFEEELVRRDFPFTHDYEGPDDCPAHIKSSLFGCDLTIPISNGQLALGTWQGIYLCEHRDDPHRRNLLLTLNV